MSSYDYDLIVIGGGAGGLVASKIAAGLGKRVALVERERLGGECTNRGCIPSKALIRAAAAAHAVMSLGRFGLEPRGDAAPGTGKVMKYVRSCVRTVYEGHSARALADAGITVLDGSAAFIDNERIGLNGRVLSARRFIIATGSSAFVPPIDGLGQVPYLTNENFFDLQTLPSSLIMLGGGPIGIELSQALNRLGVRVTVVEAAGRILPREDAELAGLLAARLAEEGVAILTDTQAVRADSRNGTTVLTVRNGKNGPRGIEADALFIAAGRIANVEGLALEKAGVKYTPQAVVTDSRLRTTAPNIYACGDAAGPYLFSHMTEYQAVIAARNALLPFKKKVNYDTVAWCTFTDPELAHAGLTEAEARKRYGDRIVVHRYEYRKADRAVTDGAEYGLAKFICNRRGMLLGAHILGERAGEVIHEAQMLRHLHRPFTAIAPMIHIYPTLTDVVRQPAKQAYVARLRSNPLARLLARLLGMRL